jgi:indolepyruvate ferredoxin oxidoreductase, beta subunit
MLPALAGNRSARVAAEAIANARTAALLDPEGEALTKCLAEIESQSAHRIAAE